MQQREFITKQIEFIRKGGLVKRYHTKNTIAPNTVAHHSFGVAHFCYLLSEGNASVNLIMAALCHDMAEQVTGDISSPTKRRFPELAAMVQKMEYDVLGEHDMDFEMTLGPEETTILKMADCMDGMTFCINEFELGNHSIIEVYNRYVQYFNDIPANEHQRLVFNALRAIMTRHTNAIS